jgi:hypothetical protein
MSDADRLAAALVDTTANLARHIERRADEIAGPRIDAIEMAGQQQVGEMAAQLAALRQRKDDLIVELRRQLDAQVKSNGRLHREVKATRSAVRHVEALKVWTNEDGKGFVFADELWAAMREPVEGRAAT